MKTDKWDIWLIIVVPLAASVTAPDGWHFAIGLTAGMLSLVYMKICEIHDLLEKQSTSKKIP